MLYQISAQKVPENVFDFLYLPTPNSDWEFTLLINRADFWALAGITAVDKGIEISNEACLEDDCAVPESGLVFQWGRQVRDCNSFFLNNIILVHHSLNLKDCSTSPSTTIDVGLPGSLIDHDGVMDFFFNGSLLA